MFHGRGKTIGRAVLALVVAFLTTIILLLGFAFLLLKLQLDAGKTELGILVIYVLSCFAGGWYCGRKAAQRKFLWGFLTGILYFFSYWRCQRWERKLCSLPWRERR